MNFIFDIGNVLIDFKPEIFLRQLLRDPAVEPEINRIIFKSREWVELDRGTVKPEEACRNFCAREPGYSPLIRKTMAHLTDMLTPMMDTVELLPAIKNAGHKLFFLSNYHTELKRFVLRRYSFFSLFDGGIFSCDVHMLKPSPEFYELLLQKYDLCPRECVFFDDMPQNVAAAQKAGMRGVVFKDAADLRRFLPRSK